MTTILKSGFSVILGFIVTPILLSWLGDEKFGTFRVIVDWYNYTSILELGLTISIVPIFGEAVASNDPDRVRKALDTTISAFLKLLPLILSGVVLLYYFLPQLISDSGVQAAELGITFLIVSSVIIYYPMVPFKTLLDTHQRSDIVNLAFLVQLILMQGSSLLFVHLGFGLYGMAMAHFISITVYNIIIVKKGFNTLGEEQRQWTLSSDEGISQKIWSLNWDMFYQGLCGRVALLTDNILVGYFFSSKAVVPFFLTQRLLQITQMQLQGVGNSVWASLANIYHSGEKEKFREKFLEANKFIGLIGFSILAVIAAYNNRFITVWVGAHQLIESVTILSAIIAFLQSILTLWVWVIVSTGDLKKLTRPYIIYAALNLIASLFFIKWIGVPGPLWGTVFSMLIYFFWVIGRLTSQHLELPLFQIIKQYLFPGIFSISFGHGMWILSHSQIIPMGWITTLVMMGISFSILIGLNYLLFLTKSEKEVWNRRILKLLKISKD